MLADVAAFSRSCAETESLDGGGDVVWRSSRCRFFAGRASNSSSLDCLELDPELSESEDDKTAASNSSSVLGSLEPSSSDPDLEAFRFRIYSKQSDTYMFRRTNFLSSLFDFVLRLLHLGEESRWSTISAGTV